MEKKDLNLYQRISKVMEAVEYLKKDDSVGYGNSSYKAISEEKVTETVRAAMIKHGLVIFPVKQISQQEDRQRVDKTGNASIVPISMVDTEYKIVNIDNPAEFEVLASSGQGVDTQDKGIGKAMTYAYKYLLLRTFAIPTGEDPDKIHNDDLAKGQAVKAPETPKQPENTPARMQLSKEFSSLLANSLITDDERKKAILKINVYTEADFIKMNEALRKRIAEREEIGKEVLELRAL